MNSQLQNFSDLKQMLSTDKRFVAAGVFIIVVLFVWLSTTTWRQPPSPVPERQRRVSIEEQKELNVLIKDFNVVLEQAREERSELKDSIHRFKNNVDTEKEEFDWKMNSLVNKLDDITDNIDVLTNKVGTSKIHSTKLEQKLQTKKKAGR